MSAHFTQTSKYSCRVSGLFVSTSVEETVDLNCPKKSKCFPKSVANTMLIIELRIELNLNSSCQIELKKKKRKKLKLKRKVLFFWEMAHKVEFFFKQDLESRGTVVVLQNGLVVVQNCQFVPRINQESVIQSWMIMIMNCRSNQRRQNLFVS
jgi:hypothetical protein